MQNTITPTLIALLLLGFISAAGQNKPHHNIEGIPFFTVLESPLCYSISAYPKMEDAIQQFIQDHLGFQICERECSSPDHKSCIAELVKGNVEVVGESKWCFSGQLDFVWICPETNTKSKNDNNSKDRLGTLSEAFESLDLKLYPNPSRGYFQLDAALDTPVSKLDMIIYDGRGRLVLRQEYSTIYQKRLQLQAEIPTLNKGLYFVSLWNQGKLLGRTHLLVQ